MKYNTIKNFVVLGLLVITSCTTKKPKTEPEIKVENTKKEEKISNTGNTNYSNPKLKKDVNETNSKETDFELTQIDNTEEKLDSDDSDQKSSYEIIELKNTETNHNSNKPNKGKSKSKDKYRTTKIAVSGAGAAVVAGGSVATGILGSTIAGAMGIAAGTTLAGLVAIGFPVTLGLAAVGLGGYALYNYFKK